MRELHRSFWKTSAASTGTSAGVSVVLHAAVIAAAVVATLPAPDVPEGSLANRVYYIPPPNRAPAQQATRETIRYVEVAPPGEGSGFGSPSVDGRSVSKFRNELDVGDAGRDTATSVALDAYTGDDTVFTIVDVDTAAARLPESAAPRYPKDLLEKHVEGTALVQFVVDTSGFADTTSFRVVIATQPEFANSVREALPGMRFAAARIGASKVRQLVELPFTFHIAQPPPVTVEATASNGKAGGSAGKKRKP